MPPSLYRVFRTAAGPMHIDAIFIFNRQLLVAVQYFMAGFLPGVARSADPPVARQLV